MRFYGRTEEIRALRHFLDTTKSTGTAQLVNVMGRRRVGKTTLIAKSFENIDVPVFSFTVQERAEEATTKAWLDELCRVYHPEFVPEVHDLPSVISFAMTLAQQRPCVFVIDECQDIERVSHGFWSRLQAIWDKKKNSSRMLLVMSGSIISAMEEIFGDASKPMYGRASCRIEVMPFAPSVMHEIMLDEEPGHQPLDLLTIFAMTGGVAAYLELLAAQKALTAKRAVRFLFSIEGGWLRAEGNVYLANEFQRKTSTYKEILHAIADGRTKWSEIQDRIEEKIPTYLDRLETFRLIERHFPILEKAAPRRSRYRIADPYLRFWFTFVDPIRMTDLAAFHRWDELVRLCEANLPQFLGRTLEQWHRAVYLESGRWSPVGAWWDAKGSNELDLVAINDEDHRIVFGEAKLNADKYDEIKLRLKAAAFLEKHRKFAEYSQSYVGLFPENMHEPL